MSARDRPVGRGGARGIIAVVVAVALGVATPALADPARSVAGATPPSPSPHVREGGEPAPRLLLSLHTAFVYGMFSQSLGGRARFVGSVPVWNTALGTGTLDVGVIASYQWAGPALMPWLAGTNTQDGADHDLTAALAVGHTFHIGRERRSSVGVFVTAGVDARFATWRVTFAAEGYSGTASYARAAFVFGPELQYAYRFSRHVGLNVVVGGVCPCLWAGSLLYMGAGLSFFLR